MSTTIGFLGKEKVLVFKMSLDLVGSGVDLV